MRADSVARLTATLCTPGTFFRARSTRPTQEAQVMPPTPMSSVSGEIERVAAVVMGPSVILPIMARSSAKIGWLTFPWWQGSDYALCHLKEFFHEPNIYRHRHDLRPLRKSRHPRPETA